MQGGVDDDCRAGNPLQATMDCRDEDGTVQQPCFSRSSETGFRVQSSTRMAEINQCFQPQALRNWKVGTLSWQFACLACHSN
jgi:hypothetical protein